MSASAKTKTSATGRTALLLAGALLSLSLLACASDQPWIRSYELERSAALAEAYWDANSVEVASDGATAFLIDGWSFAETNKAGESFRWSNARTSSFGLMVFEQQEMTLTLRGLGFPAEAQDQVGAQTVTVRAGDHTLGEIELQPGFALFELPVRREQLILGRNDFELEYRWIRSDLPSQDSGRWNRNQRDLAAAWTTISLASREDDTALREAMPNVPQPKVDLINRTLGIATGSWIEFEFELAPGSRLTVNDVRCPACAPKSPQVDVFVGTLDRTAITFVGSLSNERRELELVANQPDLPLAERIRGRSRTLVLRAPLSVVGQPQDHVVLDSPTIVRPSPTP